MTWEALSAISTTVSAFVVVVVAAVAAVLQLRHIRLASQVQSYLDMQGRLQSALMHPTSS